MTKDERVEVYHNYISAISILEHKKDLINRLKWSEPHNIPTYEAEMTHHMALHNDVLGRIHTILKQDDFFRTLEELIVINGLHAYDDIQLFPELFDTAAVIERVTSEADLIEKQLNRCGMYPLPKTPVPCTSGFVPRPSSMFKPITSAAPSPALGRVAANPVYEQQNNGTSPGNSLPCGQGTQIAPASSIYSTPQDNNTTPKGTSPNDSQTYILPQNVASQQPSVPASQPQQPLPVAPQQQSPLFHPQFPNPNAVSE